MEHFHTTSTAGGRCLLRGGNSPIGATNPRSIVRDRPRLPVLASFAPLTFTAVRTKLQRLIPAWMRNRYGAAVLVLLGWIAFFVDYDLYTTWKLRRELSKMKEQHEWYGQEIQTTREQLHELNSNAALLEKFARERYLMKRENEEIFVLVPEKD